MCPATSKDQQRAAGMALSAKRGKSDPKLLQGAAKQMYDSMSEKDLEEFASTKHDDLPEKVQQEVDRMAFAAGLNVYPKPLTEAKGQKSIMMHLDDAIADLMSKFRTTLQNTDGVEEGQVHSHIVKLTVILTKAEREMLKYVKKHNIMFPRDS